MSTTNGNLKNLKVTDPQGNVYVLVPVDTEARQAIEEAKELTFDDTTPLKILQDDQERVVLGADTLFTSSLIGSTFTEFSSASTYDVDQKVVHNSKLYNCTTAVSAAGAWTDANWTEITLIDLANQYATSTVKGVVKLGSDAVQNIVKNEPTRYKHRTYPVQTNKDGQMVVNVPWTNDFKNIYKGVLILTIEGTCTDAYIEATSGTSEHVTTQIVSPYYDDVSVYGYNTYSVVYHEDEAHPADHRPEFHVDNAGKLYFTFDDEHQEALAFHFVLSIASKTGYNFIEDAEPVFAEWGHDRSMKQPVMDMARTLVVKKSEDNTINTILGNGINLVSPKTVDLTTTYKIEAVAEYMYTCTPPEFIVFDAVDDQGNNMINEDEDNMVFCEDNPDYIGE